MLDRDGRIVDSGPARADKVGGLGRLLDRWGVVPAEVAHIGDGRADAAIFPLVGLGLAFNSALPDVERAADAAVRAESLTAILPLLASLRRRRPVNGARRADEPSNT